MGDVLNMNASLNNLFSLFKNKNAFKEQNSALKRLQQLYKASGYTTYVSGSVIWAAKDGVLFHVVFSNGEPKLTVESKDVAFEHLSCPLPLLDQTNLQPNNNLEWREAVQQYWDKMNPKLKKGKRYEVLGNNQVLYIDVEKVTRSKVYGKFLGRNVNVNKLSIGQPKLKLEELTNAS